MQSYKQYWLSGHDYEVVITPNSYHHIMIMKLRILRLDAANKPSPMSKGVTEIWINSQPCKGINLIAWPMQARRTPRVATIHNVTKKSGQFLSHPSAVFDAYASADTPRVARTLSHTVHPWSKARYHPTHRHTKLLRLGIPCPVYISTFQMLVHSDPTDAGLNRHRRGLPP
jgi:hypothetical protein